jgi:hypothetical protein
LEKEMNDKTTIEISTEDANADKVALLREMADEFAGTSPWIDSIEHLLGYHDVMRGVETQIDAVANQLGIDPDVYQNYMPYFDAIHIEIESLQREVRVQGERNAIIKKANQTLVEKISKIETANSDDGVADHE